MHLVSEEWTSGRCYKSGSEWIKARQSQHSTPEQSSATKSLKCGVARAVAKAELQASRMEASKLTGVQRVRSYIVIWSKCTWKLLALTDSRVGKWLKWLWTLPQTAQAHDSLKSLADDLKQQHVPNFIPTQNTSVLECC
jgi:hypothetical protein